jgi:hypothetical protein
VAKRAAMLADRLASFSAGGMLTVTNMGTGAGTVVSIPSGINCGSTCTAPFTGSVQLTATPLPGSTFASWGATALELTPQPQSFEHRSRCAARTVCDTVTTIAFGRAAVGVPRAADHGGITSK